MEKQILHGYLPVALLAVSNRNDGRVATVCLARTALPVALRFVPSMLSETLCIVPLRVRRAIPTYILLDSVSISSKASLFDELIEENFRQFGKLEGSEPIVGT